MLKNTTNVRFLRNFDVDGIRTQGGPQLWYCYDVAVVSKRFWFSVKLFWDLTNVWVGYDITPPPAGGGVPYDVISASPLC